MATSIVHETQTDQPHLAMMRTASAEGRDRAYRRSSKKIIWQPKNDG